MRQQPGRWRHHRADAYLADVAGFDGGQLLAQLVEIFEHHARIAHHGLAEDSRFHAACVAHEQRHADGVFEFLQGFGGSGLGHRQFIDGAPQRSGCRERDHQLQMAQTQTFANGGSGRDHVSDNSME